MSKSKSVKSTIPASICDYISVSLNEGVEPDMIKVGLVSECNLSFNKAGAVFALYLKEEGLATKRVGFTAMFHDFLKEGIKSKGDVTAFIDEHGSANTKRHERVFQAQAELTNAIWGMK